MAILPHPPVVLSQIRVHDIWLLLTIGGLWECACRSVLVFLKRKTKSQRSLEDQLYLLQLKTAELRKLGVQTFVETSKLERQVLVLEKQVAEYQMHRKQYVLYGVLGYSFIHSFIPLFIRRSQTWEKRLLRYGNIYIAILVFFLYYSIPILSIDSLSMDDGPQQQESAKAFMNRLLFPLSYGGIGLRMSKFGMIPEHAETGIGALVVMWSAQVTMGKIMDGMDALFV